jgi:hypothetical protein
VSASGSSHERRFSRRTLLQGAGAFGLSAASSGWLRPTTALAATATENHLGANYLPSQPTGWPPQQGRVRDGVGVTIGGHLASLPFALEGTAYEVSLLAFGQPGSTPDPVYGPEPTDPTIDFKRTLQKAWGAYYSFRYRGGLSGRSAISVQSYSVVVIEPTATHPQLTYGMDVFGLYEPDPSSSDPPISADLRWIEVSYQQGRSSTEFHQRACPYYFPGGLTSVYGLPACSFYSAPAGSIATKGNGKGSPAFSDLLMSETFLAHDTGRKDHAGKGIIDIYGGIKWGWQVQAAPS